MSSFYRGEILQADELNGEFAKAVQRTGDTMAGTLVLAHDPVVALDAASKRYVDNILGNAANTFLPITGGTLTGSLILHSDPTVPMQAATKQYVDDEVAQVEPAGVEVSDTPPANPSNGDLWFDSIGTQLYIRYDDGTSSAWVVVTNQAPAASASAGVESFNTRLGAVTLNNTDVTTVLPPSSTTPSMDGTAAIGSGTTWARADHVHPSDTTRQTAAQVTTAVETAQTNVGRNLVHNAGFTVAQRGAGPWTASAYTLDRWAIALSTDAISFTQGVMSDANRAQIGDEAATYYLANVFTGNAAAGAYTNIAQPIEDVRRLAGKTVTVSFYAAAGATPKFGANLLQYFGSGGSPSAAVSVAGQSVTLTTSFARYSLTFSVPSISGKTLGSAGNHATWLQLWYSSGATNATNSGSVGVQSGTILLWGVQLEIGSVATPLEKRDPMLELQQCQRFYQYGTLSLYGYQASGNIVMMTNMLPVPMRTAPTIVPTITATGNLTGATISATTAFYVTIQGTSSATANFALTGSYTASADL